MKSIATTYKIEIFKIERITLRVGSLLGVLKKRKIIEKEIIINTLIVPAKPFAEMLIEPLLLTYGDQFSIRVTETKVRIY